jgi:hypothetical protein
MRISRIIGALALSMAATVLAACGSSNSSGGGASATGNYCSELKSDKAYFQGLTGNGSDAGKLDEVFQRIHQVAADAPDNVSADWKKLDDAITTLENALNAAGIKPSDLASMQSGKLPPNVDPAKLQALLPKLQQLNSQDVSDAADRIAADAKKTCNVDLNGGS